MKNALQEYYQEQGLQLPTYTHDHIADEGWLSTLTLPNGQTFRGLAKSKKEADQEAARLALGVFPEKHANVMEKMKRLEEELEHVKARLNELEKNNS